MIKPAQRPQATQKKMCHDLTPITPETMKVEGRKKWEARKATGVIRMVETRS